MSLNCTNHHYACDCREVKFLKLEKENYELKITIKTLLSMLDSETLINNIQCPPEPNEDLKNLLKENKK